MILNELKIHNLRNISSAHVQLSPRFNWISGPNGSGKTSILEALYLLSCGHSFRSREISSIVSYDQAALTVFARGELEQSISVQKSNTEATQIKLNNQFCQSTSQIAYTLPCQVFYSELFQIIDAGPSVRRSVLDWGLFHVKQNYLGIWKDYKRVLKQRNALLKTSNNYHQFIPWDNQLSDLSIELDKLRNQYFEQWKKQFHQLINELTEVDCQISYYRGWDRKNTGKSLAEVLSEHFDQDKQRAFTQYGAHQADLLIETVDLKAKNILSRGQQKIILIALKLAQADMMDKPCLFLFDDLPAELDLEHQTRLFNSLAKRQGQFVITNTMPLNDSTVLMGQEIAQFKMKSGIIYGTDTCNTAS